MKVRNWISLVLIVLCLAGFEGYRVMDRIATDTKAPQIEMDAQLLEVSVSAPRSAFLEGVTAWDEKDGDVTGSLVVESLSLVDQDGTVNVVCAAFDRGGNVAKAERQVRFTDYKSPKFSLGAPLVFNRAGFDILSEISVADVLDGEIQHRIRLTELDEDSLYTVGVHDVQMRVTNSLGDTVTLKLPVEVINSDEYNAQLSLTDYLVYMPVGSVFRAESYLSEFTMNRKSTSLQHGLAEDMKLEIAGRVDTSTPGVYSVSYKITNSVTETQKYTGYSKLIVIVEG